MSVESKIPVAVLGVGHLGRHHARVYTELPGVQLVRVVDVDERTARRVGEDLGVPWSTDPLQPLTEGVRAVSVAVPTVRHLETAEPYLRAGISCLVEKPIAPSLDEADRMIEAARSGGALLQIGHIERFNPAFQALREQESPPVFIEAHRLAPFTFRSTDVGVVQDLMIHDLDLVLAMVRSPLERVDAVGGRVFTDTEDVVSARLNFENGTAANITASRVSQMAMRRFRIFSEDSYLSLDLGEQHALIIGKGPRWDVRRLDPRAIDPNLAADRDRLREFVFNGLLTVREFRFDPREPLKEELSAFLDCVRAGKAPLVRGEDGRAALDTAVRIVTSLQGAREARERARTSP